MERVLGMGSSELIRLFQIKLYILLGATIDKCSYGLKLFFFDVYLIAEWHSFIFQIVSGCWSWNFLRVHLYKVWHAPEKWDILAPAPSVSPHYVIFLRFFLLIDTDP